MNEHKHRNLNQKWGAAYDFELEDHAEHTGLAPGCRHHDGDRRLQSVCGQIIGSVPPHCEKL